MTALRFSAAVLAALDERRRRSLESWPLHDGALASALDEALQASPGVVVEIDVFATHVAERLPEATRGAEMLAHMHIADLYLACACLHQNERALALFESRFRPELEAIARRFEMPSAPVDDLVQSLRVKLFLGRDDSVAKIAEYAGQGFLQNWLRVTATRTFIDATRPERATGRNERSIEVSRVTEAAGDLELDYLKEVYRQHFRSAFARAVHALPPDDRAVLRHHAVSALTIDQIAAIYHVHRATAARRIESARKRLLEGTRRELASALSASDDELDSVLRLVESRLDVSLRALL